MIMAMSAHNDWWKPEPQDKICYMTEQVIQRISPSSTTNSHVECQLYKIQMSYVKKVPSSIAYL